MAALKDLVVVARQVGFDTSGLFTPKYGNSAALKTFVDGGEGIRKGAGDNAGSVIGGGFSASGFVLDSVGNGG